MHQKIIKLIGCLCVVIQLSFIKSTIPIQSNDCIVSINAGTDQGTVSPNIMGFNIVYCYESDAGWQSDNGKVPDITVAEELKRVGYRTGIIGKWGLEEGAGTGAPNAQGFDFFYGYKTHIDNPEFPLTKRKSNYGNNRN